MTHAYSLVTAPTVPAITAMEMEIHARAQGQPQEQYLPYIAAAQGHVETITSRKLISQTWKWFPGDWPAGDRMIVPFGKLSSVTHIKYTDTADTQTTFSTAYWSYSVNHDPGLIALKYSESWPSTTLRALDPIEIQFVCGWATPEDVPYELRSAILLFAGHLYENREAVSIGDKSQVASAALALGFDALVASWRIW